MKNESIPNLTAYDDAALDQAFAALAEQAAEGRGRDSTGPMRSRLSAWTGWGASRGG